MANQKTTDLDVTITPVGADIMYIVDNGSSRQVTVSNLFGAATDINTNLVTLTGTQTLTNKTLTSPTINTPALGAGSVDAITEIASGLKSGSDSTLVTGTAGTNGNIAQWNADGDLVDASIATSNVGLLTTSQTFTGTKTFQDIEFTTSDPNLATGLNIQVNSADPTRGIYIPAQGMFAATTSGAASGQYESTTNKNNMKYFAFDMTSDEYVHFSLPSPLYWDAGTITAQFYWTTEAGGSAETVDWGIQGVATANDDTLDVAYGTPVTVTDTWIADDDLHVTSATSAVTIAGSPAAGEWIDLRIFRDTSEDDLGGDAWLLGCRLAFKVSQFNDA